MLMNYYKNLLKKTTFRKQIQNLLLKSHEPIVYVKRSSISEAGLGVYIKEDININSINDDKNEYNYGINDIVVLCLYPGIYTPGIPNHIISSSFNNDDVDSIYFAKGYHPPSGLAFHKNEYILNLVNHGGYLDGYCAITNTNSRSTKSNITRSDGYDNPSACGQLINHSNNHSNVQVISFLWNEILLQQPLSSQGDDDDENENYHSYHDTDNDTSLYYSIPNSLRCDGVPWYFDPLKENIVYFPSLPRREQKQRYTTCTSTSTSTSIDTNKSNGNIEMMERRMLCGAAIILTKPVTQIESNEELLLNYALRPPYPDWAIRWYNQNNSKQAVEYSSMQL